MQAGGALVLTADPGEAARRAAGQARAALGGLAPSFAVLFASPHFLASAPALVEAVAGETGGVPLIGCVAAAVAGGAREVETEPAVSLWLAADLGPVETFGMEFVPTSGGGAFGGYRFGPDPAGVHLMIGDPFTFPADALLAHLNERVPGADPESGAIAVGEQVEPGQTVQFHVRDARSADEDLRHALERAAGTLAGRPAAGALLFTCTGRGARMFSAPDHDAGLVAEILGGIPVAGFFCDGELGPVGGRNFLHTFTASLALFPGAPSG